MKFNRLFIGLGLSCALALSACDKIIEVEPEYVKDGSQIYTSLKDYEFALTGSYALFRATAYYGTGAQTTGSWSILPDMMGTNLVQTSEDLANWQNQVNWVYTADESDVSEAWLAAYSVIAQANLTLRNIDQFAVDNNVKAVNRIKGQALAIRAMVHFDLLRFWGEEYDRNSTKLGIPYKTAVDIEDKPARLTVKESYDKILADMEQAETLLGDVDKVVNAGSSRANIDKLAVQALLARIHLYAKNYAQAESYATLVIDARPLATKTEFPAIWKDASTAEVIWAVSYNAGEGSPATGIHIGSSNRNRFRPSATLEATYDQGNDIRFPAYFGNRALEGVNRRIVTKYYSRGTTPDNLVNWKALRTGEMYLIRAEARAQQGAVKAGAALTDLNALRAARINNYVPVVLVGQALLDAIALERQKELFAEGHQWFDLKRTTKTINRTDVAMTTTVKTLAPTAREWTWPIPTGELDANPTIKPQQTPGFN
jgi:starch-binding outer membrane protein, SusD/RagB family